MASKNSKRWLGNLCMLLVPVGVLKLSAIYFGLSDAPPATDVSNTSAVVADPASSKNAPIQLSPEEVNQRAAAAAYVQATRLERFGATPFYYVPGQGPIEVTTEPTQEPVEPGVPTFTVQVIMASDDETKALIDGKTYRVGDEFRDGWIIHEINNFGRTVTIIDPATRRTSTRAVKLKGER